MSSLYVTLQKCAAQEGLLTMDALFKKCEKKKPTIEYLMWKLTSVKNIFWSFFHQSHLSSFGLQGLLQLSDLLLLTADLRPEVFNDWLIFTVWTQLCKKAAEEKNI